MAANTPVPPNAEIDALIAQHWPAFATVGPIPLRWLRAAFRDGLARWGAQPAPAASPVPFTEAQIEAAAKKLAECMEYPWEYMPEPGRKNMRKHAQAVLEAADGITKGA
jgi:hypothetical protein